MRLRLSDLSFLPLAVALAVGGIAAPAFAEGGPHHDRIYADSFGNLVVHSRSGYKRIVVGQGHLARELAEYERPRDRDVVYLDDAGDYSTPYECWRPAVLLKGRSYMYGLEDGELPDLPGKWCGLADHAAPGAALRRVQP